CKQGIQFPLTF
nr:immunoglobulin light chain junction region [Macaca mulatta]